MTTIDERVTNSNQNNVPSDYLQKYYKTIDSLKKVHKTMEHLKKFYEMMEAIKPYLPSKPKIVTDSPTYT